jgi:carbamoylphosphate synthase large subunit
VGYPVFVKPNVGVGANDSYALHNEAELQKFLAKKLPECYIMEEYINGFIVSFDGVCDSHSDVVFCTSDHFMTADRHRREREYRLLLLQQSVCFALP